MEQQAFGKPNNPEFLLKQNELLRMFSDLYIVYFREGIVRKIGGKQQRR